MKRLIVFFITEILLLCSSVYPELTFSSQASGLGIYTGISLPLGKFGEDYSSTNLKETPTGFANPGLCAGLKYVFLFKSGSFGWTFDGSVVMNSFDRSGFETTFRYQNSQVLSDFFVETLKIDNDAWWFNIPLLTGPIIQFELNHSLDMYVAAMAGVSFLRAPKVTVSGYYYNGVNIGNVIYDYKVTPTPGFAVDAGLKFNVITLGARVSFMGSKEVDAVYDASLFGPSSEESYKREIPVMAMEILLGFVF